MVDFIERLNELNGLLINAYIKNDFIEQEILIDKIAEAVEIYKADRDK